MLYLLFHAGSLPGSQLGCAKCISARCWLPLNAQCTHEGMTCSGTRQYRTPASCCTQPSVLLAVLSERWCCMLLQVLCAGCWPFWWGSWWPAMPPCAGSMSAYGPMRRSTFLPAFTTMLQTCTACLTGPGEQLIFTSRASLQQVSGWSRHMPTTEGSQRGPQECCCPACLPATPLCLPSAWQ